MKDNDYMPSEKDYEDIKRYEAMLQDKDVTIGLLKQDNKVYRQEAKELSLLVHRLCNAVPLTNSVTLKNTRQTCGQTGCSTYQSVAAG